MASAPREETVVLRARMGPEAAALAVEARKADPFRSRLRRPPRGEVRVHSVRLVHEASLSVRGSYSADYYRRAVHQVRVGPEVTEVVAGGTFAPLPRSRLAGALRSGARRRVDLEVEEHVVEEREGELCLDCRGGRIARLPHRPTPASTEGRGERALEGRDARRPEVGPAAAAEMLRAEMRSEAAAGRDLREEFRHTRTSVVYAPVYEATLAGPSGSVRTMRIDAVSRRAV